MDSLGYIGILILVFLLAIILGLQIQITGLYREFEELRKSDTSES